MAFSILLAAVTLAGLWVSYHQARWPWHLEGDIAQPYLFWLEVVRHGFAAAREWRYSQANWLLSVLVPDLGLFWAFGPSPWIVMLQGWFILVLSCAGFAALLAPITGWRPSAIVAAVLLFAGPSATGVGACLSYAVTHNASLLWGIAALICILAWVRTVRYVSLLLGGVCLFIAEMSDPWMLPAFALPILMASIVVAAVQRGARATSLGAGMVALCVILLVRSRLFDVFWFLPTRPFAFGTWQDVMPHLRLVSDYVSVLLNIVPVPQPDSEWVPPRTVRIINCTLAAGALVWSIVRLWRHRREMRADALLLGLSAALSCGAVSAAFVISDIQAGVLGARYFPNCYFFLPALVLCAASAGPLQISRFRAAALVWCGLFVTSGLIAAPRQWTHLPADFAAPADRALVKFLESNGLSYGYASFWSTDSVIAQWLSGGRVIIRPVTNTTDGRIVPRIPQTSPSWFEPVDVPPDQRRFFFIAAPDGEFCPDTGACAAMAKRQFGPPDQVLTFEGTPVLVWNRPLLAGQPDERVLSAAPVLTPGKPWLLAQNGTGSGILWNGWGSPDRWGVWSEARHAVILIHLPSDWQGEAVLDLEGRGFPARHLMRQTVILGVGEKTLATVDVTLNAATFRVRIPAEITAAKAFALSFAMPQAGRPSDTANSTDMRLLGLYLRSITLERPVGEP